MATWTMNVSAQKKDLLTAIDTEVAKTAAQNQYDGEANIVKPVVEAIFADKRYTVPNDEVLVSVNVSSGGVGGRTGLAINVNW
jgi:hypothetical protein